MRFRSTELLLVLAVAACSSFAAAQEGHSRLSAYGRPLERVSDERSIAGAGDETDSSTQSAIASQDEKTERSPLRLAPRAKHASGPVAKPVATSAGSAMVTVGGSLAVVLGLFVVLVWFSRRFSPAGAAQLPKEAVELLGKSALAGGQSMQLVRLGAKLVLVGVTPQGATALAEVTNATEVERLTELCKKSRPDSVTTTFGSLLRQVENEPASRSFVDHARSTSRSDPSSQRRSSQRTLS